MVKKRGVKKFLLEIPEEIWNKWKDTVPRSISLNKAFNRYSCQGIKS